MRLTRILTIALIIVSCFSALYGSEDLIKKGRALQSAKKFDEALQLYKNALKEKPTEDLFIEAASLLGKLQKYDNAETILAKGLVDYPHSISMLNLHALIKFRKGDKDSARQILEKVLTVEPDNGFARKWLETVNKGNEMPMNETEAEPVSGMDESMIMSGEYKVASTLNKEEQHELAVRLYQEMMDLEKWELDQFISLHRQVIEKCPLSHKAEESCWRLSNLYLLGQDPPDYDNVIAVLEHLLKQYPQTDLFADAKNRLMVVCEKSGNLEKVVALYEELFTRDPEPADAKVYMVRALEYANALVAVGRKADAQTWYQKVIEKDDGRDNIEARVAREKLAEP